MKKNNEKIKEAAAISYSPLEDDVPKIVALGKGVIADKMIEKAKENDIPIQENAELSHALNKLNIGSKIPPELYEIVAEVLVFVAHIDRDYESLLSRKGDI